MSGVQPTETMMSSVAAHELRSPAAARGIRARALYLIFFASGFAGLIYESIWTHYLKLFLGHAAHAQTLVLAIFMGGMAIGAALAARHTARIRNPLRLYAAIEAAIGLLALAFHPIFVASTDGFYVLASAGELSGFSFTAAKWSLATLLILPQSILLGATFPIFASAATRALPNHEGRSIATLYFANSLGGALGVLASGFVLIPSLGLPGTIVLAGLVNLAIAALVAHLSPPSATAPKTAGPQPARALTATAVLIVSVSFLSSASSFVYEVGWIRMLSLVLGSATHSFELMLSSFILGLALGGLWVRKRIDSAVNPGVMLGYVQIAMGLAAIATIPLHSLAFDLIAYVLGILPRNDGGYTAFNLVRYGVSSLIMFPAAFCAGMTLPLATRILFSMKGQGERAIGLVYSANTVGAIAGIAFAVHVGLPVLGLNYLVAAGALVDVLLGGVLLAVFAGRRKLASVVAATLASVVGTVLAAASFDPQKMASGVFRSGKATVEGTVVATAHGKTATISVERDGAKTVIRTNGKPDAAARAPSVSGYEMDEVTMTLIGAIPLMLHEAPRRVANVGFGSGITGATILDDARVERLDSIEIEPAMVRLARYFEDHNREVYRDPRSHIHIDDAKSFFAADGGRSYDLIVSEPSNPWVSGVSGLFSVEFYRHVNRYLEHGGLFAQWLQVYETHPERAASVIKAVAQSFDDYLVFALNYGDILIVARKGAPMSLAPDAFSRVGEALASRLQRIDVANGDDIAFRIVGNKRFFEPWLARQEVPANSDFAPYLDAHADRDRFIGSNWQDVVALALSPYPLGEVLGFRPVPSTPACLSINPHFGPEAGFAMGRVAVEMLMGAASPAASCPPLKDLPTALIHGSRRAIAECERPPLGDRAYAAAALALKVIPFLPPADGRNVIGSLRGAACLDALRGAETPWLELLEALADRDADRIAQAAGQLLESGQGATEARARYLLGMAMLGELGAGRAERAWALWQEYSVQDTGGKPPGLALEILRDHARPRPRRRTIHRRARARG